MPPYFFDTDDGERIYRDTQGTLLPNAEEAFEEARKLACDLFHGALKVGRTIIACVVRDENRNIVYRLMMDVSGEDGPSVDPGSHP